MPAEAIDRVHELAKDGPDGLAFCDRNNIPTLDTVEDLPDDGIDNHTVVDDHVSDSDSEQRLHPITRRRIV